MLQTDGQVIYMTDDKDNIFILQSYCTKKFNMSFSDFCSQFNVPEDLDSV